MLRTSLALRTYSSADVGFWTRKRHFMYPQDHFLRKSLGTLACFAWLGLTMAYLSSDDNLPIFATMVPFKLFHIFQFHRASSL